MNLGKATPILRIFDEAKRALESPSQQKGDEQKTFKSAFELDTE